MPYYICPNCKKRSVDIDGVDGFSAENALQCRSCGFGFLFQLMDDYYPAPTTGFVMPPERPSYALPKRSMRKL